MERVRWIVRQKENSNKNDKKNIRDNDNKQAGYWQISSFLNVNKRLTEKINCANLLFKRWKIVDKFSALPKTGDNPAFANNESSAFPVQVA